MSLSRYIFELALVENLSINVGGVAEELLKFYVQYPKCSTYQTHKYLKELYKKDNRTISYKNVHKRIQKLHKLGLISETKKNNDATTTKHGAIYYSLTTFGIFYNIKNRLLLHNKNLIIDHRYDGLYENFLYPYIKFNTINQIDDIQFTIRVCGYLAKCCDDISEEVNSLKDIQLSGGYYSLVTSTKDLINLKDKKSSTKFIKYVKEKFKIRWLDEKKFQLDLIENNLNLIIKSGERKLYLKLYPDEEKAVLSNDNNKICEFYLEREQADIENYELYEFIPIDLYDYIVKFVKYVRSDDDIPFSNQYKLCYQIIEYINYLYIYRHLKDEQKERNKNAIRKDKNFLTLLNQFKDQFDLYYNNFLKIK